MANGSETERYARHIVLKGIGGPGQNRLKAAKVLVVGAGGLGSPVIAYLAAAGVGQLSIIDHDEVGLSNLQRQIVHRTDGIDTNKAESAKAFSEALNDTISVSALPERLTEENAEALIGTHDIVVDGTDRFGSRALVARAAEATKTILVSGAVIMFDGQVTVFAPHLESIGGKPNPGFFDLYPDTPDESDLPACEAVGVLGAVTGVIGTLMAMEVIKLITGTGEPLIGRLLLYDGRAAKFTEMRYSRRS